MKGVRKFVGLAVIAAVLNPLCCCIAEVVAKPEPAKAPAHSCCTSQNQAPSQDKSTEGGGCASDEGCAHKQGAYEREAPVHAHGLVVAPAAPAVAQIHSEEFQLAAEVSPSWELAEHGPPGRHDPPAWLRSHSFLN